jgi:formylglycine-generating enzyme required for sulfatase activity
MQLSKVESENAGTLVLIKDFYMGKYTVTQEQYKLVTGTNPSYFHDNPAAGEEQGKRPVECVNWYEAIVHVKRMKADSPKHKPYYYFTKGNLK